MDPAFRQTPNGWQPIDLSVGPATDADAALASAAVRPIHFGRSSSRIVAIDLDGGPVTFSSSDLSIRAPSVNGSEVVYANVAPDTDIRYLVTASGLKEEIVLRAAEAPTSFTFHLSDPKHQLGLPHRLADGSYRFDALIDGDLGVVLSAPFAFEQAQLPALQPGSAHLQVAPAGDGFSVAVSVDQRWLAGKRYPIVLDPTTTFSGSSMTAGFDSNADSGNDVLFTTGDLTTGTDGSNVGRSFFKFDLSSIQDASVSSATLGLYVTGCLSSIATDPTIAYQCGSHTYVEELHQLTGSWSPSSTTWNNFSSITASSAFSSITQAAWNTQNFWQTWDVTSETAGWANGSIANDGFVAKLQSEPLGIGGPYWNWHTSTSNQPYLSVTYTPGVPTAPPSVSASQGDTTAQVNWSASGGGGTTVTSYTVTTYEDSAGGAQYGSPVTVCGSCLNTSITGLQDGQTYHFTVYATNSVGNGLPTSSNSITLPPAIQHTASCGSSTNPPTCSRGQGVTFTVTFSNPAATSVTISGATINISASLAPSGTAITVDGSDCTVSNPTSSEPTCTLNGNVLQIGTFTLASLAQHVFQYSAVVIGPDRGCAQISSPASATDANGTATVSANLVACDAGLGLEDWQTYVSRAVGPQSQAMVNVGNGNLVVQATDSTPIQAHGRLAYVLRRTYNSQEIATFPGSFGKGWRLNMDDLDGDVGGTAMYVPNGSDLGHPLALTLIDRDGTRHIFQEKALGAPIDVTPYLNNPIWSTVDLAIKAALAPTSIQLGVNYNHLCVDETYAPPPGVDLAIWRYVEVESNATSNPCANPNPGTVTQVVGYGAIRPDRLRYEFAWDGHLLSMVDANGVEMRYEYQNAPLPQQSLGNLSAIYEPRSCPDPTVVTCRAFRFSYPSSTETDISDPAGRVTKYYFDTASTPHLTKVVNPDGSSVSYSYGGCTGATADQLCSITDPRGSSTTFTYTAATYGMPKLATITDRRGTNTRFTYYSNPDYVTADVNTERERFQSIDSSGRVGEIDEGDTGDNYSHQAFYTWDVGGSTCRQPDAVVDNLLCKLVRKSLTTATPDEVTNFTYNAEGKLLHLQRMNGSTAVDTTYGYHSQYFEDDGTVKTYDDSVAGSGAVTSASPSTGRGDAHTLFFISDKTQYLTPRGNAAGTGYAPYLTTYLVDDNSGVNPVGSSATGTCSNPSSPTANSGNLCEVDSPSFDGTHATVTRYTYDSFGQKITMTTPKAIAETPSGQTPPSYGYTYYQDSDLDLSASVSAGGWLKGVTDPSGNFVAFAYDRAGNVVRTWDRNATQGMNLAQFPGTTSVPASSTYSETLYASGSNAYSAPWRYVLSQKDPLGNLTTYTVDANGNVTKIRPPRGNAAGSGAFDITQVFDAGDNLTSTLMPAEAAANQATTYGYDVYGNRTSTTDPDGNVTVDQYDSVNRLIGTEWTRGPWPTDTSTVPSACRESLASDAPIPAGRILCSTSISYDGVDNKLTTQDGNHQTTTYTYDGLHEQIEKLVPRNDGTLTNLETETNYDPDGNVTDICPPRQYSEGGSTACGSTGYYSLHLAYDNSDRVSSVSTYRDVNTAANVTKFGYDADGNRISLTDGNAHTTTATFNLLDRRVSQLVPRDASHSYTTTWAYDPVGNVTATEQPAGVDVGSGSDGALTVDGSQFPQTSPYLLTSGKNFSSLTLQNGAWIKVAPAAAGDLEIKVSGSVSICAACGITVAGTGPAAGSGSGPGQAGGSGGTGGGGGGAGHAAPGAAGSSVSGGAAGGQGGSAYGASDLSDLGSVLMGSGGGNGGSSSGQSGGTGGAGGGFLHISASSIDNEGTLQADGVQGGSAAGGGGGGGSAGSIWLSAPTVTLGTASIVSVQGGAGGAGGGSNLGGAGASGLVRIDADSLTGGTSLTFQRHYTGRLTAHSYDSDNRVVDTVVGADNAIASQAGLPDVSGGINVRTRVLYDADGHVAAEFDPGAFSQSVVSPNAANMQRTDFDVDGRPTAQYLPRYDGGSHSDTGLSGTQTSECPTGASPQAVAGVPSYPSGVGVCVERIQYDPAGRLSKEYLPTSSGSDNRYNAYSYTDEGLLASVDAPSPSQNGGRVISTTNLYDADGKPVKETDALGHQTTYAYTSDELLQQETGQPNGTLTHVTKYAYDANGNQTKVTDPVGNASTQSYWTDNLLKDSIDLDPLSWTPEHLGDKPERRSTKWEARPIRPTRRSFEPRRSGFFATAAAWRS